ncbi:type II secretion system protein GspN [Desulfocicer niacini]
MGKKIVFYYTLYALIAFVFFLYFLFPGDKLAVRVSNILYPYLAPVSISMDRLELYPPLGVGGRGIEFSFSDGGQLLLDQFRLKPSLFTVFDGAPEIFFETNLYQGTASGKIKTSLAQGLKQMLTTFVVDAVFKDLALEQLHYGNSQGAVTVSCIAGGQFTFSRNPDRAPGGTGEINISNCSVDIDNGMLSALGMPGVNFSTVKITYRLQDNRVEILGCRGTGPEMTIDLTGRVDLATPVSKSRLDLKGRLQPDAGYLAAFKTLPPMISGLLGQFKGKGLPFKIKGTLATPGVSL